MKKDPLNVVKMLAEISELEKSRQVADSMMRLTAERERLALLEQYVSEYAEQKTDEVSDIEQVRARHNFLTALAGAIGDQGMSLEQLEVTLERHIESWRHARANAQAVGRLTDRRAAQQRRREQQTDQRESDERAGRVRR